MRTFININNTSSSTIVLPASLGGTSLASGTSIEIGHSYEYVAAQLAQASLIDNVLLQVIPAVNPKSAIAALDGGDVRVFMYVRSSPNTFDSLPAGSDVTGDGSILAPFASIQKCLSAIEALQSHVKYFVDCSGVHETVYGVGGNGQLSLPPFNTPDRLNANSAAPLVSPILFNELPINIYATPTVLATLNPSFTTSVDPISGLRTYTDNTANWTVNQFKGKFILGSVNGQFATIASNSTNTLEVATTTAFTGPITVNDYSASLNNANASSTLFTLAILASGVQIHFAGIKFSHSNPTTQAVFTGDALACRFSCCDLQGFQGGRSRFLDIVACYIHGNTAISGSGGGCAFNLAGAGNAPSSGLVNCYIENTRFQLNAMITQYTFNQCIIDSCTPTGHGGTGNNGQVTSCQGGYRIVNCNIRNGVLATQGGVQMGGHAIAYFGGTKCGVENVRLQSNAGSGIYAENPGRLDIKSVVGPVLSGSAASFIAGAPSGLVRLSGLTGMFQNIVGSNITISGAQTSANNGTFKVGAYVSATSIDIINASAVVSDGYNGSIVWVSQNGRYGIEAVDGTHIKSTDTASVVTGALGDMKSGSKAVRTWSDFRTNAPVGNELDISNAASDASRIFGV